uniref:Uncharacterized protein n=1 Tax=Physcomitrium patens TaxID=3218 RepID=A0A2K1IJ81_PHYPA|nr:hypothetical protein PHYPA_028026 [Physcomitrium patens]
MGYSDLTVVRWINKCYYQTRKLPAVINYKPFQSSEASRVGDVIFCFSVLEDVDLDRMMHFRPHRFAGKVAHLERTGHYLTIKNNQPYDIHQVTKQRKRVRHMLEEAVFIICPTLDISHCKFAQTLSPINHVH